MLGPYHFCPFFAWNVPLISLIFLKRSLVFPILLFFSISLHCSLEKVFLSPCNENPMNSMKKATLEIEQKHSALWLWKWWSFPSVCVSMWLPGGAQKWCQKHRMLTPNEANVNYWFLPVLFSVITYQFVLFFIFHT